MQKIIFVLAVLLCSATANTQATKPIVATPGVGVNGLKLGMSEKQVVALLKGDITWSGYHEQLISFVDYNVSVDSILQFVLGFDSCGRYQNDLPENLPVFALYFKNHRLNFITISSFSATPDHLERFKLSNGLKFHDKMSSCIKKLGAEYVPVGYGDYTGDHYYYKLGMEAVYDENRLVSVGIFPPTPRFKAMIREKSAELKKQIAELDKD